MKITDGKRTIEVGMKWWNEKTSNYSPDGAEDILTDCEWDDDLEVYTTDNVQDVIDYLDDWKNYLAEVGLGGIDQELIAEEKANLGERVAFVDEIEPPKRSEALCKAQAKYDGRQRKIMIRLDEQADADLIAKIEAQPSMQAYIKQLIREDLKK